MPPLFQAAKLMGTAPTTRQYCAYESYEVPPGGATNLPTPGLNASMIFLMCLPVALHSGEQNQRRAPHFCDARHLFSTRDFAFFRQRVEHICCPHVVGVNSLPQNQHVCWRGPATCTGLNSSPRSTLILIETRGIEYCGCAAAQFNRQRICRTCGGLIPSAAPVATESSPQRKYLYTTPNASKCSLPSQQILVSVVFISRAIRLKIAESAPAFLASTYFLESLPMISTRTGFDASSFLIARANLSSIVPVCNRRKLARTSMNRTSTVLSWVSL